VPRLISGFDVALQPAAVPYASPLKVFEYMAAGRAIVAPDQPNLREVLDHGRTALLFDPARPGALWEAVLSLASDAELRARLGAAAREEVLRRNLTWSGNARRVAALAEEECRCRTPVGELATDQAVSS
jgi:glycosyltransferase involved in cell wall biosynthesis